MRSVYFSFKKICRYLENMAALHRNLTVFYLIYGFLTVWVYFKRISWIKTWVKLLFVSPYVCPSVTALYFLNEWAKSRKKILRTLLQGTPITGRGGQKQIFSLKLCWKEPFEGKAYNNFISFSLIHLKYWWLDEELSITRWHQSALFIFLSMCDLF